MIHADQMSASQIRELIRKQEITGPTAGMANGFAQANLVVLKKDCAFDFLLFCQRNPKPCPLLDVTDPGCFHPKKIAEKADIRKDLPKYRIYKEGIFTEETTDITEYWENDMVAFLLGCSFTFETALLANGLPVRHIEEHKNVPMYKTNVSCEKAGIFDGPMVVSMRPMLPKEAIRATQITTRFPAVHGAPIQIGERGQIGITDLSEPDFGEAVTIREGEVPVFWACGVTPQAVALQSKPPLMITHAPGHMFISDIRDEDLSVL